MGNTECCSCKDSTDDTILYQSVDCRVRDPKVASSQAKCEGSVVLGTPCNSVPVRSNNLKENIDNGTYDDPIKVGTPGDSLNPFEFVVTKKSPDDKLGMQAKYGEGGLQVVDISPDGAVARSMSPDAQSKSNLKVGDVIVSMDKEKNDVIIFSVIRPRPSS